LLASVWRELLHLDRVGRQDNFFELGGHSLLVVQLIERLRGRGLVAQVRNVFDRPVLADLAITLAPASVQQSAATLRAPPNRIPERCEAITPQMLPLVDLTAAQIEAIAATVPGGARNVQDIYPLAPLQEGILFHHLLDERSDPYVLPKLLEVHSRDQVDALLAALQAAIDRHDVLRTAVLWKGLPQPVQVVYRRAQLKVEELNFGSESDALTQMRARMAPERQRLDLQEAPLLKLQIARGENGQWLVLLQLHHLVSDHVSMEWLVEELRAHMQGKTAELPEPLPYREYVAGALQWARESDAQRFFSERLSTIEEPTAPFGLMEVHGDATQIEESRELLDGELGNRLRRLARELGISTAALFHAAWARVVAATSSRDKVVFGTVMSGRLQGAVGADRALGMFINTLPICVDVSALTARELVKTVHRELLELLKYEPASLALAQTSSGVVGGAPLFTALLNYRHSARVGPPPQADTGLSGIRVLASRERSNYPVELSVSDLGAAGFALTAQVHRSVGARRVIAYTRTALESLAVALQDAADTPAATLAVLPEAEHRQLTIEFNESLTEYPQGVAFHRLFEARAQQTPGAPAVEFAGRRLTYGELNRAANRLARTLRRHGVAPDTVVAAYLERSMEVVVAVLGIWKSGGAYLPLDPGHPSERIEYMLKDAAPALVLTQARLQAALAVSGTKLLAVDEQYLPDGEWVGFDDETDGGATAQDLAYVIYTSGSTGQPKGAMLEHAGLCNLASTQAQLLNVGGGSRLLQFSSLSFDASIWECAIALASGACLCIVPREELVPGEPLLATLQTRNITHALLPPAALAVMSADHAPASLRTLVVGGEACPEAVAMRWSQQRRVSRGRTRRSADRSPGRERENLRARCATPARARRRDRRDPHRRRRSRTRLSQST
jgi:non-ribosomal peptide synthetase component F